VRVVLDTNVVVSAFPFDGLPQEILLLAGTGGYELVSSFDLIAELEGVLLEKLQVPPNRVAAFRTEFVASATLVQPYEKPGILDDPADDEVLAVAAAAAAQFVVTGDRHLLAVEEYQGAAIVTPRQFLDWLHGRM
jgi:putative PIN family toxin of toxin-antitoxin system